jgi:hypothetical protein
VNVLSAAAFIWLAVLDYSKHQAWEFAIQQQDFLIRGIPVDEAEKNADGDPMVELFGKRMQKQLFASEGQAVTTQKAAVEQRHSKLLQDINAAGPAEKAKLLEKVVIPFARSAFERATLREKINAKDANFDAGGSDSPFELAYKDATNAGDAKLPIDAQRGAIARFLFCSSIDQPDYQFALTAVGLDYYAREVERQATALRNMVPEIELAMAGDRASFERLHRTLIDEIVNYADHIRRLQDDLGKQNAQLEQYKALIGQRKADVEDLEKRISAAKQATEVALAKQTDFEQALINAQTGVSKTSEANHKLETEIKNRELGR